MSRESDVCRGVRALAAAAVLSIAGSVSGQENYTLWTDSARVFLNTTATGANISANVLNFPVLVRLNSSNFTFSRARADGADLRFVKSNRATTLKYDREFFDQAGQQAAVWVKLDTVYGNSDTQYFMMYWGRASAPDSSQPAAVFSPSYGYAAVWHLGEAVADGVAGLLDATSGGHDATPDSISDGQGGATGQPGLIGRCVVKDTVSGYIDGGDAITPATQLTVSAWVRPTNTSSYSTATYSLVEARKSGTNDAAYRLRISQRRPSFTWVNTSEALSTASTMTNLVAGQWCHLTGVRYGDGSLAVFRNGVKISGTVTSSGTLAAADMGTRIGGENVRHLNFPGAMDEVRIHSVARDSFWIKLEYKNQQATDSLVRIETGTCVASSITTHPSNQTVTAGVSVSFSVVASGSLPLSYQWQRDSAGSGYQAIAGATAATYSFTATIGQNGNRYRCVVTNACNTATSNVATLTVTPACVVPVISAELRDTMVTVGSSLTLSVSTSAGNDLQYEWYKNGIVQSGRTTASWSFGSIGLSDSGQYMVVVYNGCGRDTSQSRVRVCQPPAITVQPPPSVTVQWNSPVSLSVTATGTGLNYQWQRNPGSGWVSVGGATGSAYNFVASDTLMEGYLYRCVVNNACGGSGVTSSVCTLHVTIACDTPRVTAGPASQSVVEKSSVSLSVTASGTDLTYQWLRNGVVIPGAAAQANPYVFTAYRADNGASYSVTVRGRCGSVTSGSAVLTVQDTTRPHPTTQLTLNALSATQVDMRWGTPESDSTDADSVYVLYSTSGYLGYAGRTQAGAVASGQKVVSAGSPAGERSVQVGGLTELTKYWVTLWVRDTVGNWACADSDTVRTPSSRQQTNPVVVRGTYVDDTHIRLRLSNFCGLPATVDPLQMYVVYVGVWYRSSGYHQAPDTSLSGEFVRLPLGALQSKAGCPGGTETDTVIAVPALSGTDSVYYLSVSVRWKNPDNVLGFVRANGDSVLMRNVTPPVNGLTVTATYLGPRGDSAEVVLGNTGSIEDRVNRVVVRVSSDGSFSDTLVRQELDASVVRAAAGGVYRLVVRSVLFDGEKRTVYVRAVQVSTSGVSSAAVTDTMQVGHDLPVNPMVIQATALGSDAVEVRWESVAGWGVDSVRVFYDTLQIPTGIVEPSRPPVGVVYSFGSTLSVRIGGLNAATLYYVAAEARIGGEWTAVTADSRASVMTGEANPADTIENRIVVDGAYLDTVRNYLVVTWHYRGGWVPEADSVEYGYTWGRDSAAVRTGAPGAWFRAVGATGRVEIELGEEIVFETAYYVALRLRPTHTGGSADQVSDSSMARIEVRGYTWEPVVCFRRSGDTVEAFNGHVRYWFAGNWVYGASRDTVEAVYGLSYPPECIPVSVAVRMRQNAQGPAIVTALQWDSIPLGYSSSDVRMYHWAPGGEWTVYHAYTLYSSQGLVAVNRQFSEGEVVVLLVDTRRPVVEVLSDTSGAVPSGVAVSDRLRISDNVAGVVVRVLFHRGEEGPLQSSAVDTVRGLSTLDTTHVPGGYVNEASGVRIYVVVSDGPHTDTVNLSRSVVRAEASDIMTEPGIWMPLRTTAVLDAPSVAGVVREVTGGEYDTKEIRIYRWFDPQATTESPGGGYDWVEYGADKDAVFALRPGKLEWVKTRNVQRLIFGRGVTTSLRKPVDIGLREGQWTDVALPYLFRSSAGSGLALGDILDATGPQGDSLYVYRWERGTNNQSVTELIYAATIPDSSLRSRRVVLSADPSAGYSIYNRLGTQVTLRVPPVCWPLSRYKTPPKGLARAAGVSGEWSLKVSVVDEAGGKVGSVYLGYSPRSSGGWTWYPAGPSFASVGVGVVDGAGQRHGHAVAHGVDAGGVRYRVEFRNTGEQARRLVCRVAGTEQLPDHTQVRVVEPLSGVSWGVSGDIAVEVPAKGSVERVVTVGGRGYERSALGRVSPLAQFTVYPNPCRGRVSVQFALPPEMGRVEVRAVGMDGRVVWERVVVETQAGTNRVAWDAAGMRPGMYVLQVAAFDLAGRRAAVQQRRVVVVR